ncbi:uncharacterized protein LOC115764370 [Drosophila novamexicana]|uniref:uncharacterized protein LOC115764370 n=1 Tax=Drosophila novamexicana TaxID=47314 RepID=UPI0011E60288|nr:uncharacterized protein LOC115764370 [Drosophila novamexicana]
MRGFLHIIGLLLCCLWLMGSLGQLYGAPVGYHVDHAGCIRVTIVKQAPTTTTTTATTTTTTTPATTRATVAPG